MTQYNFQNKGFGLFDDSGFVFETVHRRCHFCGIGVEVERLLLHLNSVPILPLNGKMRDVGFFSI